MYTKKKLAVTAAVAVLAAVMLWGGLLTGSALAQNAEPVVPHPGWNPGMMALGMTGQYMMGNMLQAGVPLTGTRPYGGPGMMNPGVMNPGVMGYGMMRNGVMGSGMMRGGMMREHMGYECQDDMPSDGTCPYGGAHMLAPGVASGTAVTGTMPYADCPYAR